MADDSPANRQPPTANRQPPTADGAWLSPNQRLDVLTISRSASRPLCPLSSGIGPWRFGALGERTDGGRRVVVGWMRGSDVAQITEKSSTHNVASAPEAAAPPFGGVRPLAGPLWSGADIAGPDIPCLLPFALPRPDARTAVMPLFASLAADDFGSASYFRARRRIPVLPSLEYGTCP